MKLKNLALLSLFVPALAFAQPKTADDYYKEGETQYNLGNFLPAVEAFKKGFELEPNESKKAAYLYNVAQSYRLAKDCGQAVFFYKRYLSLKDQDQKKPLSPQKRTEIEGWIKELDTCAKAAEAMKQKQPDGTSPPDKDPPGGGDKGNGDKGNGKGKEVAGGGGDGGEGTGDGDGDGEGDGEGDGGGISKATTVERPRLISVRAFGGGAKVGAGDIEVPVQATFGLIAGYPLALSDQFVLDLGAGFTFTPVPYQVMGMSKTATLSAIFADVGATYLVIPKLGIRGDVGIGGLFFGNVSESQFTGMQETTGALTMMHLRVSASVDYAITPNILVTVVPFAFSMSPAKKGLRDDVKRITAIDFMVGIGYRM